MCASVGATCFRTAGRIAQGAVAGDRFGQGRMAYPGRADEDARATHRAAVPSGVEILRELEPLTNREMPAKPDVPRYVFPGGRSRERPMSENAILAALRRMGYTKDEMTGHGFRSIASTLLHEQGWNHQVIERQLAHAERNAVSAAYNFAEHLPERRKMMQAWSDYLDSLKGGADVIPLFKRA